MKYIVKDQDTPSFDRWKASFNVNSQPTYKKNKYSLGLIGLEKKEVKKSLMKEQGYICCYCERRLTGEDSHIEHFNPQSNDTDATLDYTNMLCSCQDQLEQGEPRHCGHSKADWFDENLLISPLDPDCERCFAYTADGKIQPADKCDNAATTVTIEKLRLDIEKLNDSRKKAIEPFLDEDLDGADFLKFVNGYLKKNSDDTFNEFWTTIDYLFVQKPPPI